MGRQVLENAQVWAEGKSLSDQDYQFLAASQNLEKRNELEVAMQYLTEVQQQADIALDKERQAEQSLTEFQHQFNRLMDIGVAIAALTIVLGVVLSLIMTQALNSAIAELNSTRADLQINNKKLDEAKKNIGKIRDYKEVLEKANKAKQKLLSLKKEEEQVKKSMEEAKSQMARDSNLLLIAWLTIFSSPIFGSKRNQ